jgi:2-keto-4-pentenoate hydratase/2-oxohepta-3-ene-1,7-dioic acid hydratase in catechol pathway
MRIVRFLANDQSCYGILKNSQIHSITGDPFTSFATGSYEFDGRIFPLSETRLLSPSLPSKIICLGVNYRPHAQEMNSALPSSPLIFLKPPTSMIGPEAPIILPRQWKRVDYEGELGIIIGKKAKYVTVKDALSYILGYTCFNDVTERHYQKEDGQWTRGKGFDTFAPCGPWIETDVKPDDLKLETCVNGEVRQSTRTSDLIFGIPTLVSFISGVMTLLPGDVIATGTPAGVGPLKPGDIVEIKIENIGSLRNPVAAHPD